MPMFYEDITVERNETVQSLVCDLRLQGRGLPQGLERSEKCHLVARRRAPEHVQSGDTLLMPIPWKVVLKRLTKLAHGGEMMQNGTESWGNG